MLPMTPEDLRTLQQQRADHDALLLERVRYKIFRPDRKVPRSRTPAESHSTKEYTGDVVHEYWDNIKFREHKYFVQEEQIATFNVDKMGPQYKAY